MTSTPDAGKPLAVSARFFSESAELQSLNLGVFIRSNFMQPKPTKVLKWLATFMIWGSDQKIGACHPDTLREISEWIVWAGFALNNDKDGLVLMTPYGKIRIIPTPQFKKGTLAVIDALDYRPKASASIKFTA